MSGDILQEVLLEFIEVWLHNVIYKVNLYPSQIFRSRYKYNISLKQSSFPALNNYLRNLVLSLQPQLQRQSIHNITLNILQDLEIQESFTLTISYPTESVSDNTADPPEKIISRCKDMFRGHIVSVLNCESKQGSEEPSDERTFSVSVKTSELAGTQMTAWCCESVVESFVARRVEPLLFTDVGNVRVQSLHRM
ncbi:hypothetical protein ACHWQZ_G012853 [Mnemiopsis leidyi]